jgi:hypothetical protein
VSKLHVRIIVLVLIEINNLFQSPHWLLTAIYVYDYSRNTAAA